MQLTAAEKETIILFNETTAPAEVFTYNKRTIKKLKKLADKFPDEFKQIKDNGAGGLTFQVPKRRVLISAPKPRNV